MRASGYVADQCPPDPLDVDPGLRPEALVLDGHHGSLHPGRDVAQTLDYDRVGGRRQDPDQLPGVVVQERVLLVLVLLSVLELRQVGRDRHHHPEGRRNERQRAQADHDREQAKLAHARLGRRLLATSLGRATTPSAARSCERGGAGRRLAAVASDLARARDTTRRGGRSRGAVCGGPAHPGAPRALPPRGLSQRPLRAASQPHLRAASQPHLAAGRTGSACVRRRSCDRFVLLGALTGSRGHLQAACPGTSGGKVPGAGADSSIGPR